jgi:lysophospholipase L1-like esterase
MFVFPPKSRRFSVCGAVTALAAAVLVPAHAQVSDLAHIVAPAILPAATPAAAPAPTPAVAAAPTTPAPSNPTPPASSPIASPPPSAATATPQFACSTPAAFARFDHPLRRSARRLAADKPLKIVAIGSSSTAGAGASSPDASYPSRLAAELKQRFPGHDITVINRGVNGEETANMMARFEKQVIAEHPDLVLWQVGTNSVLRDHSLKEHAAQLHEGIEELKATGTDVALIDLQFTPKVVAKSETLAMADQIAMTAKEENVDLFSRFAIMRNWYEIQHIPFDAFTAPDELHMNDWGYACVAKLLAAAITEASSRPVASAAARGAH